MEPETALAEHQILDRAAGGDSSAFECIVRSHQGMVFSLAYHFLHDRAVAEELAQDVFLSLYRNLASIKSPAHLVFWLRKVTGHRCLDQARRQRLRQQLPLDQVPEPSFEMALPDIAMTEALQKSIAALPEKQRAVLILRYQEDLEPLEIARALDMPLNTVKSHLRRSIIALREKLAGAAEKYYEQPGYRQPGRTTKNRADAERAITGFYRASARAGAGEL